MHYSQNELGPRANRLLLKLIKKPFPNQLKSLCLSNLKTTGAAVLPEPDSDGDNTAEENRGSDEPKVLKMNVLHELSMNLL